MDSCCEKESKIPRISRTHIVTAMSEYAPSWSGIAVIDMKLEKLSSQDFAGKYLVILFYPCDFSFLCPIELIQFNDRIAEFRDLGTEIVAISTDSKFSHFAWVTTPRKQGGLGEIKIPLVADKNHQITQKYGILNEQQGVAHRALFIVDQQGIIRHVQINDDDVPRSADETLRIIRSCRFVDEHGRMCLFEMPSTKNAAGEEADYFSTN